MTKFNPHGVCVEDTASVSSGSSDHTARYTCSSCIPPQSTLPDISCAGAQAMGEIKPGIVTDVGLDVDVGSCTCTCTCRKSKSLVENEPAIL